ncbi:hypothetical protein [Aquibacillus salsiterrae]|uniref:Uncharacterized protein n=1 Tax=Aquibacillus salsiterrae TaxID=2950439 RepID=A0A9X4AFY2_9BACI|nr:hypothetical protein [Aquibacillus salsiterrae]MDC3416710.1 hypothetical protein [Aquibacillus salsiterrae]
MDKKWLIKLGAPALAVSLITGCASNDDDEQNPPPEETPADEIQDEMNDVGDDIDDAGEGIEDTGDDVTDEIDQELDEEGIDDGVEMNDDAGTNGENGDVAPGGEDEGVTDQQSDATTNEDAVKKDEDKE